LEGNKLGQVATGTNAGAAAAAAAAAASSCCCCFLLLLRHSPPCFSELRLHRPIAPVINKHFPDRNNFRYKEEGVVQQQQQQQHKTE